MAQNTASFKIYFAHNGFDHCGFSFAVPAHKTHFLATGNTQISIFKDNEITVFFRKTFRYNRIIATALCRRKAKCQCRSVYFINFYNLQFFQHLLARVHLVGFGIGSFKPLNKQLCFRDEFLLLFVSLYLMRSSIGPQLQVMGIIGFVIVNASHCNFNSSVCYIVNKFSVVRNYDYGFCFINKKIFQPNYRFNINVVGGLIQ